MLGAVVRIPGDPAQTARDAVKNHPGMSPIWNPYDRISAPVVTQQEGTIDLKVWPHLNRTH